MDYFLSDQLKLRIGKLFLIPGAHVTTKLPLDYQTNLLDV